MARIRNIRPEYFTDSDLCELPPLHRLLFAGLWCQADRNGRLEDKPKQLKVQVLPYDNCDTDEMLAELHRRGFIQRYEVAKQRFIQIPNFSKHQRFSKDEKPRELPEPPPMTQRATIRGGRRGGSRSGEKTLHLPPQSGPKRPDVGRLTLDAGLLTLDAGQLTTDPPAAPPEVATVEPQVDPIQEVFEHWRAVMKKPASAKLGPERSKAVQARLKDGYTVEDLKRAVDGCALTPHNMGKNERGERFNDLELICREGKQVERFMANADTPPSGPPRDWRKGRVGAEEIDKSKLVAGAVRGF